MNSRGCAVINVEYSGHGGLPFDVLAGVGGAVEAISTSLRAVFGGGVRYYERWQDAAKAIALWTNTP